MYGVSSLVDDKWGITLSRKKSYVFLMGRVAEWALWKVVGKYIITYNQLLTRMLSTLVLF